MSITVLVPMPSHPRIAPFDPSAWLLCARCHDPQRLRELPEQSDLGWDLDDYPRNLLGLLQTCHRGLVDKQFTCMCWIPASPDDRILYTMECQYVKLCQYHKWIIWCFACPTLPTTAFSQDFARMVSKEATLKKKDWTCSCRSWLVLL